MYSPLCRECELDWVEVGDNSSYAIGVKDLCDYPFILNLTFGSDGTYMSRCDDHGNYYEIGECMLFPSKYNRDWSTFKVNKPKFDPKTLKPFDRVIVCSKHTKWKCELFSHFDYNLSKLNCICAGSNYEYCVPYNDDTIHLLGTMDEAPEFYRYWEE